jgi:hypothetical protein
MTQDMMIKQVPFEFDGKHYFIEAPTLGHLADVEAAVKAERSKQLLSILALDTSITPKDKTEAIQDILQEPWGEAELNVALTSLGGVQTLLTFILLSSEGSPLTKEERKGLFSKEFVSEAMEVVNPLMGAVKVEESEDEGEDAPEAPVEASRPVEETVTTD